VSTTEIDAFVQLDLKDATLVVSPGPGDADGFIDSLIPQPGVTAHFSVGVRFSSSTGLHLTTSENLTARLPVSLRAGNERHSAGLALTRVRRDGARRHGLAAGTFAGL
jgi:hypothetical protein